jgi:hypothetical protein
MSWLLDATGFTTIDDPFVTPVAASVSATNVADLLEIEPVGIIR